MHYQVCQASSCNSSYSVRRNFCVTNQDHFQSLPNYFSEETLSLLSFAYIDFRKASAEKVFSLGKLLDLSELQFHLLLNRDARSLTMLSTKVSAITDTQRALKKDLS